MSQAPIFTVSDFVAVFNQTVAYAYPSVSIVGELTDFRVSKNRWVYFSLKDDTASVKFWGSVYSLPGPLEEGMMLKVVGSPQLHPQFGFSITISSIQLAGEGSIKKAAKLLEAKLEKEGLFNLERKRALPYPPRSIALVTSGESAAYADFIKILQARWGDVRVNLYDVLVQGADAPAQIVEAIEYFNSHATDSDVLVVTRGGGSADDLQAFNAEIVTRAIAGSRIPTLVAIGHEIDVSLAEKAADKRASTPSNAAELLTPDKKHELTLLDGYKTSLLKEVKGLLEGEVTAVDEHQKSLDNAWRNIIDTAKRSLIEYKKILDLLDPSVALRRGYALLKKGGQLITPKVQLKPNDNVDILLLKQELRAKILTAKKRA